MLVEWHHIPLSKVYGVPTIDAITMEELCIGLGSKDNGKRDFRVVAMKCEAYSTCTFHSGQHHLHVLSHADLISFLYVELKGCTHRAMILCDGAIDSHRKE